MKIWRWISIAGALMLFAAVAKAYPRTESRQSDQPTVKVTFSNEIRDQLQETPSPKVVPTTSIITTTKTKKATSDLTNTNPETPSPKVVPTTSIVTTTKAKKATSALTKKNRHGTKHATTTTIPTSKPEAGKATSFPKPAKANKNHLAKTDPYRRHTVNCSKDIKCPGVGHCKDHVCWCKNGGLFLRFQEPKKYYCIDLSFPCNQSLTPCHKHATCKDHKTDFYFCKCNRGFQGNGTNCTPIPNTRPKSTRRAPKTTKTTKLSILKRLQPTPLTGLVVKSVTSSFVDTLANHVTEIIIGGSCLFVVTFAVLFLKCRKSKRLRRDRRSFMCDLEKATDDSFIEKFKTKTQPSGESNISSMDAMYEEPVAIVQDHQRFAKVIYENVSYSPPTPPPPSSSPPPPPPPPPPLPPPRSYATVQKTTKDAGGKDDGKSGHVAIAARIEKADSQSSFFSDKPHSQSSFFSDIEDY